MQPFLFKRRQISVDDLMRKKKGKREEEKNQAKMWKTCKITTNQWKGEIKNQ